MNWYRAMAKQKFRNGAENTHLYSYGEILRGWNELVQSYNETNIWWNGAQNKHPCSHDETAIWWNGEVQRMQRWNVLMVKRLYSPLTAVGFLVPSNDGDLSQLFTSSAAVSPFIKTIVSEWCHADSLNRPRASEIPFDFIPTCFCPIYLSFSFSFEFLPPPPTPGVLLPFHTLLILSIDLCTCTGDITSCQALIYYCTKHKFHMDAVVTT